MLHATSCDRYPNQSTFAIGFDQFATNTALVRTVFNVLHTGIEIPIRTRHVTDRSNENEPDPRYFK